MLTGFYTAARVPCRGGTLIRDRCVAGAASAAESWLLWFDGGCLQNGKTVPWGPHPVRSYPSGVTGRPWWPRGRSTAAATQIHCAGDGLDVMSSAAVPQ